MESPKPPHQPEQEPPRQDAPGHTVPGDFWSAEQPPPWPGYGPPSQQRAAGQPLGGQQPWVPPSSGQPGPGQQPGAVQPGQPPWTGQPGRQPWDGQPGQHQWDGQPGQHQWTGQPGQQPWGGQYPGQQPWGGQYPSQQPWIGPQHPGQPPWPVPYGAMPGPMRPREPRAVQPPSGTPYHQLARTFVHSWWRPLVGTAMLAALAFFATAVVLIGWSAVHALITGNFPEPEGDEFFASTTENLALTLVMLGILTPLVAFTAWTVQRRPAWSVASVLNRIRWKWLFLALLPGLGYLVLSYGLGLAAEAVFPSSDPIASDEGSWVGFAAFIGPALLILLLVPFQAGAEEFVFRGWLIQVVGAYAPQGAGRSGAGRVARAVLRSPWPALVVSSALFVSAHGYTGWAMADIFLFAMTVGFVTVRTGGIEAAIGLHTLNNLLAFLLPAATGRLDGWAEQGGAPWTVLAVDIPCLAFYAVAVLWLAKRRQVERFSR